jgi:hypothetical protein
MQNEINIKFCHSATGASANNKSQSYTSSNLLCEKCNNYQELKLQDLKNFTSRSEVYLFKLLENFICEIHNL